MQKVILLSFSIFYQVAAKKQENFE